jgi:putative solute:sodium symporter small subunit
MTTREQRRAYWRANLRITVTLLAVWFAATFLTVWFVDDLNTLSFFGFPLGFYMAAQGSLVIFVVIVWIYARAMNWLDRKYGVAEEE